MLKRGLLVFAVTLATGVVLGLAPDPAAEVGALQLSTGGLVRFADFAPNPGAPAQRLAQN